MNVCDLYDVVELEEEGDFVYITSPGYPREKYPGGVECYARIRAPEFMSLEVKVEVFQVKN